MKRKPYVQQYFNVRQSTRRATLEFNLDDPYSADSFLNAIKADEMALRIEQFHDVITRPFTKYDVVTGWDKPISDEQKEILNHFIEKCLEYMYNRDV